MCQLSGVLGELSPDRRQLAADLRQLAADLRQLSDVVSLLSDSVTEIAAAFSFMNPDRFRFAANADRRR
jgi:hypothetical protein